MTLRMFAVSEALYIVDKKPIPIAGVPEYGQLYYGEYTGRYPYQAASKAFTGLQKHMKKFNDTGDWFPDYDPDTPPEIMFKLVDVSSMEESHYHGIRVAAHQGDRIVTNANDGRVRNYRWDNKVSKIDSELYPQ
jgi:hypothetical protein